ncbi:hypothetical protein ACFX1T_010027 [Malus domestica]
MEDVWIQKGGKTNAVKNMMKVNDQVVPPQPRVWVVIHNMGPRDLSTEVAAQIRQMWKRLILSYPLVNLDGLRVKWVNGGHNLAIKIRQQRQEEEEARKAREITFDAGLIGPG